MHLQSEYVPRYVFFSSQNSSNTTIYFPSPPGNAERIKRFCVLWTPTAIPGINSYNIKGTDRGTIPLLNEIKELSIVNEKGPYETNFGEL